MFIKCFTHIMVAMATYFPPQIFVKNDFFSNQAHFFFLLLLPLKQELKKDIRNVQKMFYTIIMVAMATFFPNFCEK